MTYDAVQLAVVAELQAWRSAGGATDVTVVSADRELNAAAISLGLRVDDPKNHP